MTKENTTKGSTRWLSSQVYLRTQTGVCPDHLGSCKHIRTEGPTSRKPGFALINHGVPVTEAVAADVAVHDGIRAASEARWKTSKTNKNTLESLSSIKVPHSWVNKRVPRYSTGNSIQRPGINQTGKEYTKEYICICITGSQCCTEKINTPL